MQVILLEKIGKLGNLVIRLTLNLVTDVIS